MFYEWQTLPVFAALKVFRPNAHVKTTLHTHTKTHTHTHRSVVMEKLSMTNRFNSRGLTSEMGWWEMKKYAQGERYYIMERIQCEYVCVGEARGGMPSGWDWRQPWWICMRRGIRRKRHVTRGQTGKHKCAHAYRKKISFSVFLIRTPSTVSHPLISSVTCDNTVTGGFVGGFWPWRDNP